MIKYMEEYINDNFKEVEAKEILLKADNILSNLEKHCMDESKSRRKNLFNSIYPCVALYEALQSKLSKQKSFQHMDKMIFNHTNNSSKKVYKTMGKLPFFFSLFRKMFSLGLKGDSWEVEWLKNDKIEFKYNVKKCLWHETFRNNNCSELCKLFCRNDEINFTNASKKIKFKRNGALGYGDELCDFYFYKEKNS